MDFKAMYFHLFNRVTDALDALDLKDYEKAKQILVDAQIKGEDMYIDGSVDVTKEDLTRAALLAIEGCKELFPEDHR